jgi:hypothetical protein
VAAHNLLFLCLFVSEHASNPCVSDGSGTLGCPPSDNLIPLCTPNRPLRCRDGNLGAKRAVISFSIDAKFPTIRVLGVQLQNKPPSLPEEARLSLALGLGGIGRRGWENTAQW